MDNGVGGILYVKTPSGLFKFLEAIFSLCAFICAMIAEIDWSSSAGSFFNITCLIALIYALIILIVSVGNLVSNTQGNAKIDLVICLLFSILTFSSASLFALLGNVKDSLTAAVVFQFFAGFAFLGNTLHKILI